MRINFRRLQIVFFMLSLFVLSSSLYFQYIQNLQPCPLCIMQRFAVILLLVLSLSLYFLQSPRKKRIGLIVQLLVAGAGLFFAGRQIWLQSLPSEQAPACLPGLDVLLKYFPWQDIIHALLWGSGDCAEVTWQWLGLSMPAWSALYFCIAIGLSFASLAKVDKT